MGRESNSKLGLLVLAVVALVASNATAATVNERARLREGPSKDTALLGWVDGGASVTIEGERNGWYAIRSADGTTGYVWQDHLTFAPGERAATPPAATGERAPMAATVTTSPAPMQAPPSTMLPEARPTVAAERPTAVAERPDPVAPELERLRDEIARLAKAQEELSQRLARGGSPSQSSQAAPLTNDGSAGAAALFLAVGAIVGWALGRLTQARRERRSRIRI